MRKTLCFLLLCCSAAVGQTVTGLITGTGCLQVNVLGSGMVGIQVTNSGTAWSGTIQPQVIAEADPNGTTSNTQVVPFTTSTPQATITANGSYQTVSVSGATYFQVCGNTVTNNAQIKLTPIKLAAQRTPAGAFEGVPNAVTVAGVPGSAYTGADMCSALAAALNGTLTSGQKWGGVFNTTGFTGQQVCSAANLNTLNAALQATTGATIIQLGCPLQWYLPVQTSQAATVGSPPVGMLNLTPYDELYGCNAASVADNQTTRIIACPPAGITGCPLPQTLSWPITSTVASSSGATINDRAFIHVNAAGGGMVLVGGDPFTIDAGGGGQNNTNIAGSYTACQLTSTVTVTSFTGTSGSLVFTNSGAANGLSVGSSVTLSGFTSSNTGLNGQTVVVTGSVTGTTFAATVTGSGYSSGGGTAQTGNTNIQNDSKCPLNPTPTDVYGAIENGLLALTLTPGSANGTYDSNLGVTFGAGCIIAPDIHLTFSGGAGAGLLTGAFIRHAGKCNSTPTITIVDSSGTVGTGAALVGFTAQSAAGNAASGNCPATCGSWIHDEIPIIEVVDNGGTNQNAPMGSKVHDVIIDTRQLADVICYRDLGGNEHTKIYNINCAGIVMRGFDKHSKQTNSGDEMYSIRGISGKLPNQAVPPASSGTGTASGTTFTTTAGTGFYFGLNSGGTPACNYAANTPIYLTTGGVTTANSISGCTASATVTFSNGSAIITGAGTTQGLYAGLPIHFSTTGTLPTGFAPITVFFVSATNLGASQFSVSATNGGSIITAGSAGSGTQTAMAGLTVTLGTAPGNGTYTYYVPGSDLGTEVFYAGGGFAHGLRNYTVDYSAATSTYDYPYINTQAGTAVQHLPVCGIRVETNYFGTTFMDGHTERAQINICAGLGAPVYGPDFIDIYGQPNGITNVTGQFQNYHPTNIKFFNDYYNSSLNNVATQEYIVLNAPTSFNSYYSLVDDNPVGPGFTSGPADPFNLALYGVEWSAIQTSAGNTTCVNVSSTVPGFGNYSSCPQTGYVLSGNSLSLAADTTGIVATTPATTNQTFILKGFAPNQTYRIHCSGTTTQATAGTGIGIAAAAVAPVTSVNWNLHAAVATSATATAGQASGVVTNSATATQVYLGAAGTLTTELPWTVDGYVTTGASAPLSFIIGFYTTNAANAVTVKQGSYCGIVP